MFYRYDNITKEFIGSVPKMRDPLETAIQGKDVFLYPPYCTEVKPPVPEKGKTLVFNTEKNEWVQEEDHRGKIIYNLVSKQPFVITTIGKCPEGYSFERPIDVIDLKNEKREQVISAYNSAQRLKIKVKNVMISIEDEVTLNNRLLIMRDFSTTYFDQENGETVPMDRETVETAVKTLYVRRMLLAKRQQELLSKLKRLRDKDKVTNFEVNYDIEKETKKLVALSNEEIDKYFAGE